MKNIKKWSFQKVGKSHNKVVEFELENVEHLRSKV